MVCESSGVQFPTGLLAAGRGRLAARRSRGDDQSWRAEGESREGEGAWADVPVLLQQRWEISRRYAMFATPVAYLIDVTGIITHDVAVGVGADYESDGRHKASG